jgi:hypothetical protein
MSKPAVDVAKDRAIKAFQDYRIVGEIWGDDTNRTMTIEFNYPRVDTNINELRIGLSDVRASDGIKVHYDFERDGYVIMQPYIIEEQKDTYIDCVEHWQEVGFYQSWALEDMNQTIKEGK